MIECRMMFVVRLGVYCCTAVTAVTAQNSLGVLDISYLSPEAVGKTITGEVASLPITPLYFVQVYNENECCFRKKQQLSNAALELDLYPKAVKLGMLGSICIMKEVSETLSC